MLKMKFSITFLPLSTIEKEILTYKFIWWNENLSAN